MLSVLHMLQKIKKNTNQPLNSEKLTKKEREKVIAEMEKEMKEAAKALNFERAAELRDLVLELKAEG